MKTKLLIAITLLPWASGHRLAAAFNEVAPLYTRLAGTAIVPAEFTHRSLFVSARINGRGPFRLLVDTGSSITLVTPAVASAVEARVPRDEDVTVNATNAFGATTDVRRVLLRTLEIGGVQFEGVLAGITEGLSLFGQIDVKPVDGLLGFSVFADVILGIDFPGRRLVLSKEWPDALPPVRAELAMRQPTNVPLVFSRLQGREIEVLVDTGSDQGLELPPDLAALVHWKAEPRPGPLVGALDDADREYVGRLSGELHLGPATQENPIAAIINGPANVGVGFLQSFCVVFDQGRDKMWLCAPSDDPVPAPTARSLGLSLLSDSDGWRVVGTIPGSPAEGAGITSGDVVTEIEGKPARAWTKDKIDRWTDTHEQVALRVARIDQSRALVLPVWSLVP